MAATKEQFLADVTALCDLLSDETRMHIVLLLAKSDRNVSSLIKILKVRQPTVSHHLGLLRMNRLAVAKRKGKQVFYSLAEHVRTTSGKIKIELPSSSVTVEGY